MKKRTPDQSARAAFGELRKALMHDFAAPVRHVGGFAGLLARSLGDDLSADQVQCAALLHGAVGRLEQMVSAMGQYCELLGEEPDLQPLELGGELEEAEARWRFRSVRGAGHLRWEKDLPQVLGSHSRVQLLLAAVLDNASTFIDPNRDSIVHVHTQNSGGRCEIAISDNGIGLEPQYRARATGLFWKLVSDGPGVGAGLSIARCVAESHGGRLELGDGTDGEAGICVRFSLQLHAKP